MRDDPSLIGTVFVQIQFMNKLDGPVPAHRILNYILNRQGGSAAPSRGCGCGGPNFFECAPRMLHAHASSWGGRVDRSCRVDRSSSSFVVHLGVGLPDGRVGGAGGSS